MFEYDICLCGNGENCPSKEKCLRYKLRIQPINRVCSMSLFYQLGEINCKYYIPLKESDKDVK